MSLTAVSLVAVAAVAHASWNLFSKQAAAAGTIAFVWMVTALGTVIYLPVLGIDLAVTQPHLRSLALVFLAGTALLHIGSFLTLQHGCATLQHGCASGDLNPPLPAFPRPPPARRKQPRPTARSRAGHHGRHSRHRRRLSG